ncbi:MAG: AcrR family transcriptional regulator [Paraglaciecola sp.]|jgi:AcrR family transcriptional regulator
MSHLVVHINTNPNLYSKDPQKTTLGRKIIKESVLMIEEIGLERFTFRKLAKKIESTESSIYRYFDNKHQLFVYLLNWYWEWMIARIEFNTMNIDDASRRLKIVLGVIVDSANRNMDVEFVDEDALFRIVVREGTKAYHHNTVEADNNEGYFLAYKRLCEKIAGIILEVNGTFPYPRSFANTLIETTNNTLFNAKYLPRLTDLDGNSTDLTQDIKQMLEYFAFGLIEKEAQSQVNASAIKLNN